MLLRYRLWELIRVTGIQAYSRDACNMSASCRKQSTPAPQDLPSAKVNGTPCGLGLGLRVHIGPRSTKHSYFCACPFWL